MNQVTYDFQSQEVKPMVISDMGLVWGRGVLEVSKMSPSFLVCRASWIDRKNKQTNKQP